MDIKGIIKCTLCIAIALIMGTTPTVFATDALPAAKNTKMLIPIGRTAGIKMFSDGVLIIGISDVSGGKSPCEEAGLEKGDLIIAVDDKKIMSTAELKAATQVEEGNKIKVEIMRGNKKLAVDVNPLPADDGSMRLGAWVRDSMAGIGTLTYYDPDSGVFGALGHGINDTDTQRLMPLAGGSLVGSTISSVRMGQAGKPGELTGSFDMNNEFGSLFANTERGVFGTASLKELGLENARAIPIAEKNEIKTGKATILSNVKGDMVEEYEIEITKITLEKTPRDMMIEVTDSRLIEITGGIVQGMSGSPIIQDGKLVGAVTHVLINEPTRGYAIFVENMLEISSESRNNAA